MSESSEHKKKFLNRMNTPRSVIQLEHIDDEPTKLLHSFLHHEVARMFETFFILTRLNKIPFTLINLENHRFLENLFVSMQDSLMLRLNRILNDVGKGCWTLLKYEKLIRSKIPTELVNGFDSELARIEIMPAANKMKVMKAIRNYRISHNIPNKVLKPEEIGEINWEDIEQFVLSILERFRLFDTMFSSYSIPAFSLNYYDEYYEKKKAGIHDVDCFIIDYIERHFPAFLLVPIAGFKGYKRGLYRDISDKDIERISFLQSLVGQAREVKQIAINNHIFFMSQQERGIDN